MEGQLSATKTSTQEQQSAAAARPPRPAAIIAPSRTTTPPTPQSQSQRTSPCLRYVEFYAGVGGWTMALLQAVKRVFPATNKEIELHCCAALDHSDLCTAVYEHNFSSPSSSKNSTEQSNSPRKTKKAKKDTKRAAAGGGGAYYGVSMKPTCIETLTVQQLAEWKADLWMMSPPCQPHTRQHANQQADLHDARSRSFLHLCALLQHSDWDNDNVTTSEYVRPTWILLENVVGFEESQSCFVWRKALETAGYAFQQFHLQPTQVGLPNDRPRYYCVAVRRDRMVMSLTNEEESIWWWVRKDSTEEETTSPPRIRTSLEECGVSPEDNIDTNQIPSLRSFLDDCDTSTTSNNDKDRLRLSTTLLQKPAAWCLDIVTVDSRRTSCFTASYGKYLKGTGSVLLCRPEPKQVDEDSQPPISFELVPPEKRQYDPDWNKALLMQGGDCYLRFFSGTELVRLLDFAPDFSFPDRVTLPQQWKLLGNSLNVRVAARLVELGLRAVRDEE